MDVNCSSRVSGAMRSGDMPGKCSAKKGRRRVEGEVDSRVKVEEGAKSVQVKEWSREGIAMNIRVCDGQMWRWLGEMANVGAGEVGSVEAGMWNSHHRVSIYSCW